MNEKINFLSKIQLYKIITDKIASLGYDIYSKNYKVNAVELAKRVCINLEIELIDFKEIKICGILYKTQNSTSIGLNMRRSITGRNFDCMHELIHYWLHKSNFFYCTENTTSHLEWQANEGAAQFLMPYQNFVPNYVQIYKRITINYPTTIASNMLTLYLAKSYGVGETAIEYRIKSLKGYIEQYIK